MSDFLRQYIETALWSSSDDDGIPLDSNYDPTDLAPETLGRMRTDCDAFVARAAHLTADLDLTDVAHDFWLTRNGHGAGFWDGDYEEELGRKLTEIAEDFGDCDLYVGDDGKLHVL